jgi:hypothetical protein
VTEFQSRRELREAERQGIVPKPEQVFDLPTGQINLPPQGDQLEQNSQDLPSVNEMLTRKRIREMERLGLLDPLTGALAVPVQSESSSRSYDEVLAETEEPITSSINTVAPVAPAAPVSAVTSVPSTPAVSSPAVAESNLAGTSRPRLAAQPIQATDIFHEMAVDLNARKPRWGIILGVILVVLAGLGVAAYMLGIFK